MNERLDIKEAVKYRTADSCKTCDYMKRVSDNDYTTFPTYRTECQRDSKNIFKVSPDCVCNHYSNL